MSCPSHRKKSPWQLQKSRNDRRKNFSVSCGEGTCYFSVGRRRKDHTDVQSAAHCARKGWRVLAATTTHIMQPPGGVWAQTDAELFRLWKCGSYAVAGTAAPGGKLTAPPQAQLERWMTLADIVLIEADGRKTDALQGTRCARAGAFTAVRYGSGRSRAFCVEASAPGRSVFRAELAAELLCVRQDAQLTPELLAKLLASEAWWKEGCRGSQLLCCTQSGRYKRAGCSGPAGG